MNTTTLPTDDLKKYGIIESDNSFSKKLSADDIQKFLQGFTIVADNDKSRITFQLTDNNSRLNVNLYERDKKLDEIIEKSKDKIQYTDTFSKYNVNDKKTAAQLAWTKTVFVFDEKINKVVELDMIKNAPELTQMVAERKNADEIDTYKLELQKLKNFLYDKIDQYPEIAKEISNDMNIVSREIDSVNNISPDEKQISKAGDSDIQLNVNDRDMYEDANRHREEEQQEEEQERPRGFRR
ncbi:hypothetical protein [Epilithonimonas caeni]|uniref:hypothetical protein n=1 Tax=Epilithonimonas caeni TaxID=365343 RepID=UPI0004233365|nr:hypothetical protein [Epilithonimonas caeni]